MTETIKLQYQEWGSYNSPDSNERKAELPIMFWFIENYSDNLIEIGEVSDFYRPSKHIVYDLVKERESTIVKDAFDVDYRNKNVVSVSTFEHIGFGDYGHQKEQGKAFKLLLKIIDQATNYLITFPVGYNRDLEKEIVENYIHYSIISRTSLNTWKTVENDFNKYQYNSPQYAGNAIAVITNLNVTFKFGE